MKNDVSSAKLEVNKKICALGDIEHCEKGSEAWAKVREHLDEV